MARGLVGRFGGEVPTALEDLVTLPGVGRKTANVVRSVAFGLPGLPVDTHVARLARRLDLSASSDPVVIEKDLDSLLPENEWGVFSLRLILHGRHVYCGEKAAMRRLRAQRRLPERLHLRHLAHESKKCGRYERPGSSRRAIRRVAPMSARSIA